MVIKSKTLGWMCVVQFFMPLLKVFEIMPNLHVDRVMNVAFMFLIGWILLRKLEELEKKIEEKE